jgi:PAS domain S-box-containing protein
MNDTITFWNRGAEDQYGWTRDEALGKVTHALLRTVFPLPLADIMSELTRTGLWEGELVHTRRDGTELVVASRWALQRDDQGKPTALLETNNDITERKRAEEAIRRQANLLEQTHDAIFVWEFPRTIVYWNRGAEQLYGYSREEALGRLGHDLLQTKHPLPVPAFEAMSAAAGARDDSGALCGGARNHDRCLGSNTPPSRLMRRPRLRRGAYRPSTYRLT